MNLRSLGESLLFVGALALFALPLEAARPKPCVTADEASKMLNKDICISAHIYEVVELPDGTRFLDVCSPDTPDEHCRFTIISLREDRDAVGELRKYSDLDVHLRGMVRPMHGRAGMVLSHTRQFYGGPPRFKPNPRLARGFSGEQQRLRFPTPICAPKEVIAGS